jgi:hypothetical protein
VPAENDTESITPERLEKATEIIEETAELGEFEADIREEKLPLLTKSMKKRKK